jgi:hypothetical protein
MMNLISNVLHKMGTSIGCLNLLWAEGTLIENKKECVSQDKEKIFVEPWFSVSVHATVNTARRLLVLVR